MKGQSISILPDDTLALKCVRNVKEASKRKRSKKRSTGSGGEHDVQEFVDTDLLQGEESGIGVDDRVHLKVLDVFYGDQYYINLLTGKGSGARPSALPPLSESTTSAYVVGLVL